MKKLMWLAAAAAVLSVPLSASADATWIGARIDLNADWSLASNWDGAVPTGDATATITYPTNNQNRVLGLTPPLDFTGSISVNYRTAAADVVFHNILKLNVLDGAAWTVTGNGMLYASEALSARVASTFTGVIVITNGASFTAASTLNAAVEFVGDGRLTVTTKDQLARLTGFTGTLVWGGAGALSPEDTTALQLRTLELADGGAVSYGERFLSANPAFRIGDWNEAPDDWTFGGTSGSHDVLQFDTRLAHANPDGSLALVTDPKQLHSAVYTGRKLKIHDNWGVSFRYAPAIPAVSSVSKAGWYSTWSGTFGVYMTTNAACAGGAYGNPLPDAGSGFQIYQYSTATPPAPYVGWYVNKPITVQFNQTVLNASAGPDLRQPMDVAVSCRDGHVTVVLRQGGRYFAACREFANGSSLNALPDGYHIALVGSSDWWNASETHHNVPWSTHTVSDFRGWCRAREAGRWTADTRSFYPFTTANCAARRYTAASTYTENADALEPDGSFKVEENGSRMENIIRLSNGLDRKKRHLVTYDLVFGNGTGAENTERFKFGFTRASDALDSWLYRWDASNNDIAATEWNAWVYPPRKPLTSRRRRCSGTRRRTRAWSMTATPGFTTSSTPRSIARTSAGFRRRR